jgi:RNA polymerase sigma-70 factor, ECF subfamily
MTDPSQRRINAIGDALPFGADGHLSSADLFRQFAPFVASFLLRMGVSRSDLDDVMQEVFLVAHRLGGYTPGPAKPTTYLASIAVRAATTHRRKHKVRSFVRANDELVSGAAGEGQSPEGAFEAQRRMRLLEAALDRLDDDKRAVFVMAEIHGDTVVSIAAGLGIPVDTAYSRLRAARKLFQTAVAELTADDAVGISPRMERAQP